MKTLILAVHPHLNKSLIKKRWVEELQKHPDKYEVHQLYEAYPDGKIDVAAEQQLMERYERIVFQYPLYWFNCPPLFKTWLDEVLTYGWAYGSQSGYKMGGKKIALAITAGIDEYEYAASGKYRYTIEELTRPFELTFEYVKADYRPPFVFYGIELNSSEEWIEQSVPLYMKFLEEFSR